MKKNIVLQIILSLFLVSTSIAETKIISLDANDLSNRIELLERQNFLLNEGNQVLKQYQDELRGTYQWALGFSAMFLFLFLGINIYFFRNRYNEDKEYLLMHISNKIHSLSSDIKQESKDVSDSLENHIAKLESNLPTIADASVQKASSSIQKEISSLKGGLKELKVKILDIEISHLNKFGPKAILLSKYVELAKEVLTLSGNTWDWKISDCLAEIDKLLSQGISFDYGEEPYVSPMNT